MKQQHGIALIQILLIASILSVLALYLTQTAREQVKVAQWFDDKSTALVNLHSAESDLLFLLLTETKNETLSKKLPQANFFNKPFQLNKSVKVSMQDQAGLLNAHFPDVNLLNKLVELTDGGMFAKFSDVFHDWQDLDSIASPSGEENQFTRNGKIPYSADLIHIKNISPKLYKVLQNNMSIYLTGYYNPMNSPLNLLQALSGNDIAQEITKLRDSGELTKRKFKELTGLIENDDMFFHPSNNIAITLTSTVGESVVEKKIIVKISPYAVLDVSPVAIMYTRS